MIWRNVPDKKETPEPEKRNQQNALRTVMQYCMDRVQCRRVQVLSHFGELDFDKADCNGGCDNCTSTEVFERVDVTAEAVKVMDLVSSASAMGNITKLCFMDAFRGKAKSAKGLESLQFFGAGKDMTQLAVEQLFGQLLAVDAIRETSVANGKWSNMYLIVSSTVNLPFDVF